MKFRWYKIVYFDLPFILFIVLFSVLTIKYLPTGSQDTNIFMQYIMSHVQFITFPILLFLIFLSIFITRNYFIPVQDKTKRTIRYAFGLAVIAAIAFPLAFIAVYIYAFAQINYNIISYNTGISEKQFLTSPQAIADAIAATDKLSIFPTTNETYKKDLMLLSMKKKNGYYDERILPAFPDLLYKRSYIPLTQMTFVNNNLVVNSVTPDQLAMISPALGRYLIEHTTQRSITKPLPQVEILEKPEYVAIRNKHIQSQVEQIEDVIENIDTSIASISGFIAANQESIATNQELLSEAEKQKQSVKCKSQERCQSIQSKWDRTIKLADGNIDKAATAMEKNQQVLGESIQNKEHLEQVKNEIAAAEALTDKELGLFTAQNKIIMTLNKANTPEGFDIYLATLIHEYFHYLSYVDEETKLDHFFEEALTEHFARFVFKNYTGKKIDIGYPVGVRIIEEMLKQVPEREFAEVYFSKDQKALQLLLNKTYGSSFYQDNAEAFKMITHLPFDESIEVANLIMAQIGGKPLLLNDSIKDREISIPSHDTINTTSVENNTSTLVLPE